jgi:hypothetical protein
VSDESEPQAQDGSLQDTETADESESVRIVSGMITALCLGALLWIIAWLLFSRF